MKVAIPVSDENLAFFPNAGHAPYFAVFDVDGSGMFRSFTLEKLRANPRSDLDHEHDETHRCDHDDADEEHIRQHRLMADNLEDCDYLVVKRACKNTVQSMTNLGIKIQKYSGSHNNAQAVLSELSGSFV